MHILLPATINTAINTPQSPANGIPDGIEDFDAPINGLSDSSIFLLNTLVGAQQKQKDTKENAKQLDIGTSKHVAVINSYKARNIAIKVQKQRVHRNLQLAKHTTYATIVCEETGIVSVLEIPAIPGYVLVYNHPLAELPNARGLAQQGKDYLRSLDMQVLAGIIIVLANDYSLFVYQPSDSGAQKNAILRTVQKDTLINAILTIEDMIHSSNHFYLPKLALTMDVEVSQGGIENRMQTWLTLVVEAIYKPDTEIWDENETVQRATIRNNRVQEKEKALKESAIRKEQKILKEDCKTALSLVKELYKQELISSKLRIFLGGTFQEFQLLTMDPGARLLLTVKLADIGDSNAAKLSEILTRGRKGLIAKNTPMEDFFSDKVEAKPVRVIASKETVEFKVPSIEVTASIVEVGFTRILLAGKDFIVKDTEYQVMGFLEKVKYHKALAAGTIKDHGQTDQTEAESTNKEQVS